MFDTNIHFSTDPSLEILKPYCVEQGFFFATNQIEMAKMILQLLVVYNHNESCIVNDEFFNILDFRDFCTPIKDDLMNIPLQNRAKLKEHLEFIINIPPMSIYVIDPKMLLNLCKPIPPYEIYYINDKVFFEKKYKYSLNFGSKVYCIMHDPEYKDLISFGSDGQSIQLVFEKRKELCRKLCNALFFQSDKYEALLKNFNNFGFHSSQRPFGRFHHTSNSKLNDIDFLIALKNMVSINSKRKVRSTVGSQLMVRNITTPPPVAVGDVDEDDDVVRSINITSFTSSKKMKNALKRKSKLDHSTDLMQITKKLSLNENEVEDVNQDLPLLLDVDNYLYSPSRQKTDEFFEETFHESEMLEFEDELSRSDSTSSGTSGTSTSSTSSFSSDSPPLIEFSTAFPFPDMNHFNGNGNGNGGENYNFQYEPRTPQHHNTLSSSSGLLGDMSHRNHSHSHNVNIMTGHRHKEINWRSNGSVSPSGNITSGLNDKNV